MLPRKRQYCANLAVLSFVAAACTAESAQQSNRLDVLTSEQRLADLPQVIAALMDSAEVSGVSVAIASDTGAVWSRAFGVRNAETGEPVDENTVFEAASLSKPVFAYAVMQLVDSGVVDLDTPIADFYPEEIVADQRYATITPRMVLSHTPGFPNWRPRGGDLTIDFDPGSRFSYSGEGFVYLQMAVMHATGERLQELVARLVFEPLGMTRSSYIWDTRFEDNVALPHRSDGTVLEKRKPARGQGNAAATLHTTAPDFARFLTALMTGALLSDSSANQMRSPQIPVDSGVSWGLGIGLQETDDGSALWHWGDNSGFKAYTIAYPESGIGLVWFTNSDNGHAMLARMLAATVGGTHPGAVWLDYEQFDAPARRVREQLARTADQLGVDSTIAQFFELKARGPAEAFDEYLLNTLGYRLLRAERVADAIAVFRVNVEEYPDAWNPYDSLGEAYMVAGDVELAIENYARSVQLNPDNANGQSRLEELRKRRGGS
jgi:CubicO group peptidase (beta-lactamase class C family)